MFLSAGVLKQFQTYLKKVYLETAFPHTTCCNLVDDTDFLLSKPSERLSSSLNPTYLKITDIGKIEESSSIKTILVSGAPGVGKSTLALELCRKWASGKLLQNWPTVILVRLRDQRVREAKILSDFLYYPDEAMRIKICQVIENSNGKGVLFVLDDLDHLDMVPEAGSVYQQLIASRNTQSPADSQFVDATRMIISRSYHHPHLPWSLLGIEGFPLRIDQHIGLLGLKKESLNWCISSACDNSKIKDYLESRPVINYRMVNPAQCVVIRDLFSLHWNLGDKSFSPNTLTELYTDLVRTLLLQYLSNHREYSQRKWAIKEFTDLSVVPVVYNKFMFLTHLAADGIKNKKYVFDIPRDFEALGQSIDFETLGLMRKVDQFYPGKESSNSYCFLNLTLQEYLAAYYCSQNDPAERLQAVMGSMDYMFTYCLNCTFQECQYYHWEVFLFTAGLTKFRWNVQFLSENLKSNTLFFSMMHLLYETQSPDLICLTFLFKDQPASKIDKYGLLNIPLPLSCPELLPVDFFVAGYCIPHSNRSWLLNSSLTDITCEHFKALGKGLKMSSDQCSSIGHILVMNVNVKQIQWLGLLHPHTKKLTELIIVIHVHEDAIEAYTDFPAFYPLLKTLRVITSLSQNSFFKSFVMLLKSLNSMRSLENLFIEFWMVSEVEDIDLKQLKKCHRLQHLEIACDKRTIRSSRCFCMPQILFSISSKLETLSISCFKLVSKPFTSMCTRSGISLKTLNLTSCEIPDDASTALVRFLQSQHCVLETFKLSDPHQLQGITPDKLLLEGIGSSHTLKRCVLDGFNGSIVQHLVTGMKKNLSQSCLEELTVLCSSGPFIVPKYYDELIRLANEQLTTITRLNLTNHFKESVRNHDIRENLIIDTDCSFTCTR